MSDFVKKIAGFSKERVALIAAGLQSKVESLEGARREPIAIVGMACRFPAGADSPERYWENLLGGVDAAKEIPADRWDVERFFDPDPDAPGKSYVRKASFIEGVDLFDADFFGISPREANAMDPQQRVLLETAWEAIERAGVAPHLLFQSRTGVYVGVMASEYFSVTDPGDPERIGPYTSTGLEYSLAAGRLSYALGLQGPSFVVGSACSSSLVAAHLAMNALRNGECEVALAAGVSLILCETAHLVMSKNRALATDGISKTLDSRADGYGRGEGCGVLVLKRLSDAKAAGDRVIALLRGAAVNHGGPSGGLTVPNGPAQQAVIRQALEAAAIAPADVGYLELHGTGTSLGDPIEVQAASTVYGEGRAPDKPLVIGSVKTNVGHLEAAAGVAAIMKAAMLVASGDVPPHLHLQQPNPRIPWSELPVTVSRSRAAFPGWAAKRIAGVSSFGLGGTNAHALVEAPPPVEAKVASEVDRPRHLLPISAKSNAALRAMVERWVEHLGTSDASLADMAHTAGVARSHFGKRIAVHGETREEVKADLARHLAGDELAAGASGEVPPKQRRKIAFLFTGGGAQYAGMARELYRTQPVFRAVLDRCDELMRSRLGGASLLSIMHPEGAAHPLLDRTDAMLPAIYAVEVGLASLLKSFGVKPSFVLGHSTGETAAAVAAGLLSLEDGLTLIAERGRLMQTVPQTGAMGAINAPVSDVEAAIARLRSGASIGAVNSPTDTLISGPEAAVDAVMAEFSAKGVKTKKLAVAGIASHSSMLASIEQPLNEVARTLSYRPMEVEMISTITGAIAGRDVLGNPAYWGGTLVNRVRFFDAMKAAGDAGATIFVEIGPKATLLGIGGQCLPSSDNLWLPSIKEGAEWTQLFGMLSSLYAAGADLDFAGIDRAYSRQRVSIPTYAFQRKRYWVEPRAKAEAHAQHPLLGRIAERSAERATFEAELSEATAPFTADHKVFEATVFPGAGYLDLALAAAKEGLGIEQAELREVQFETALVLLDDKTRTLRTKVSRDDFQIESRGPGEVEWTRHAHGKIGTATASQLAPPAKGDSAPTEALYQTLLRRGFRFGPTFRGLTAIQAKGSIARAEGRLPEGVQRPERYALYPGLLDALFFQPVLALSADSDETAVPLQLASLAIHAPLALLYAGAISRAEIRPDGAEVLVFAADGRHVASMRGLVAKKAPKAALLRSLRMQIDEWLYGLEWRPASLAAPDPRRAQAVWWIHGSGQAAEALRAALIARGVKAEIGAFPAEGAIGIVDLTAFDVGEEDEQALHRVLDLAKGAASRRAPTTFAVISRSALAVDPAEKPNPAAAMILGFARSVGEERPELEVRRIDLDALSERSMAAAAEALLAASREPEIAIRAGGMLVPRLVRAPSKGSAQRAERAESGARALPERDPMIGVQGKTPVRSDRSYLISGGLGGLGLSIARGLADAGAHTLVLLGRRKPSEDAAKVIAELEARGVKVAVRSVDVADASAMSLLDLSSLPPLGGVVHAAGVLEDALLDRVDGAALDRTLAPKVRGAINLDKLTRWQPLDFFVLFSSAASVLGSPGQSAYSAANAYLDAFAEAKRASGAPALSIHWGPWSDVGMVSGEREKTGDRRGVVPFSPAMGVEAFHALIERKDRARVLAIGARWPKLLASFAGEVPPLFTEVAPKKSEEAASEEPKQRSKLREAMDAAGPRRDAILKDHLQAELARILGKDPSEPIDPSVGLFDLGMDSLMAVELRNRLQRSIGESPRLPATLVMDHPTLERLSTFVSSQLGGGAASTSVALAIRSEEPIAVVGLSCRMPSGEDPDAFWRALSSGVDAIREIPKDRYDIDQYYDPDPDAVGGIYIRNGSFLDGIDQFDAAFFGIAPREATSLDPQQRIFLEVTWEALERAGVAPDRLAGSSTGVFVGTSIVDYANLAMSDGDANNFDGYFATGSAISAVAGRVSFTLGLQGPCVALDTACSSSLTALHLAVQALRNGECNLAIAGGVHLHLSPEVTMAMCRAQMLSPDGRCKTFDASANGMARGEGCGAVVLKRLSDAVAGRDRVLALIRGTAINQDGRTASITAPSGPSQEQVIRRALASAGVEAKDVDYLECHGTGTPLGDPIEVQAASAVYGEGRHTRSHPLLLGSVKSNLGHLEAAAGIAGLSKLILSLDHGVIPKNIHFHTPNPKIPWSDLPVKVVAETTPWPRNAKKRIGAVSSFGFVGTNAHAILEEAPAIDVPAIEGDRPRHLLVLSAKSDKSLAAMAKRYAAQFAVSTDLSLADACFTAATGRAQLPKRLALSAATLAEARSLLARFAEGEEIAGVVRGDAIPGKRRRIAFLCTGQGSQAIGMGRALYQSEPVFRAVLDRANEVLKKDLEKPLLDVIFGAEGTAGLLDQTGYTQPAMYALEVALAELWKSWGVVPDVVMGHSVGEYAAAAIAGVFSIEDGLKLIGARARAMQALPAGGAMAAIFAPEADVRSAIAGRDRELSIAAVNGPTETVISGVKAAVEEVLASFEAKKVKTRRLVVSHAFHSALMEPMLAELESVAAKIALSAPKLTLISNVTGEIAGDEVTKPEYWRRHVREPVMFASGLQAAEKAGATLWLELGPKPTLLGLGTRALTNADHVWLPSLRPNEEWTEILSSLGALWANGASVDPGAIDIGRARRRVELPTYPFERKRFWVERKRASKAETKAVHPLLGRKIEIGESRAVFELELDHRNAILSEHRVHDAAVFPGAAFVEMASGAFAEAFGAKTFTIEGFVLEQPLALLDGDTARVRVTIEKKDAARFIGRIETTEVHARFAISAAAETPAPIHVDAWRAKGGDAHLGADHYARTAKDGIVLGAKFRWLERYTIRGAEVLGELAMPSSVDDAGRFVFHPGLFDAAFFQTLAAAAHGDGQTYIPASIDRIAIHATGSTPRFALGRIERTGAEARGTVRLTDATGAVIAEVHGILARPAPKAALERALHEQLDRWSYELRWQIAVETGPRSTPDQWLLLGDPALAASIAPALSASGAAVKQPADASQLANELSAAKGASTVVYLAPSGGADRWSGLRGLFEVARACAGKARTELVVVTRAAFGVEAVLPAVEQAAIAGFARAVASEHPELSARIVDLGGDPGASLLAGALAIKTERDIAIRGAKLLALRLAPNPVARPAQPSLSAKKSYLITGGLGGLGLEVCEKLIAAGARHVVLVGRRPPDGATDARIDRLRASGAAVTVASADVADRAQVAQLIERINAGGAPLGGVFHAAAVLEDATISRMSWEQLLRVFAPKVFGAEHLDALAGDVDFFVVFSSAAGILGGAGQAAYSAANAAVDSIADRRKLSGKHGLSLAFGPWAEVGMASRTSGASRFGEIRPKQGVEALARSMAADRRGIALVLPFRWRELLAARGDSTVPSLLRDVVPASKEELGSEAAPAVEKTKLRAELEAVQGDRRKGLIRDHLKQEIAQILRLEGTGTIDDSSGLFDLGMDSLAAIELKKRLVKTTGIQDLPPTLVLDYPTVDAMIGFLEKKIAPPAAAALTVVATSASNEPIAIVGLACRFPGGGGDPDALWQALLRRVDAVREVPKDRYDIDAWFDPDPEKPGKIYVRKGSFLERIDQFDAAFFGISPKEAVMLDPQQRLFLEVTWEAFERAALRADDLLGSKTGVFVGTSVVDYAQSALLSHDPTVFDPYYTTGSAISAVAGRISYVFGLQGPCVAVDTACSSSVSALHLAVQSLKSGECEMAIAGGVHLQMSPEVTSSMCRSRMLSVDTRCATFDASANGFVRGEGAGAVVLKRLSQAIADKDPIVALIRGTAINQDGRSATITAPNGPSQEAVIRAALANAGVTPAEVGYLECHGTGTPLGDPIEVRAASSVYGEGRDKGEPLLLGSIKSNLGHCEAAAGIAGLMKAVLSIEHGTIPANIHFKTPNPQIAWSELPVSVVADHRPFPEKNGKRFAALSSFGFVGTNAHAIFESAPERPARKPGPERPQHLLALSAKSDAALRELASRYADHLSSHPDVSLADVAYTANVGRSRMPVRAAVIGGSIAQMKSELEAIAAGRPPAVSALGKPSAEQGKIAFLFSGGGAQYLGMGRGLYQTHAGFREMIDRCDRWFKQHRGRSLLEVIHAGAATPELDRTDFSLPAIYAIEVALTALWKSWGVEPAYVMGHSTGEIGAVVAAGLLDVEEGMALISARGELMQTLPQDGAMVAINAPAAEVEVEVAKIGGLLAVSAINSPSDTTVSGSVQLIERLTSVFAVRGTKTKRLAVGGIASHCAYMEPIRRAYEDVARKLSPKNASVPMVSTIEARLADQALLADPTYWGSTLLRPVRFAQGVEVLGQLGVTACIEVGPRPSLLGLASQCLSGEERLWLPSLRDGQDDWVQMFRSIGALWTRGHAVDFEGLEEGYAERRRVVVPTYPFQRQRFWFQRPSAAASRDATPKRADGHPLLGDPIRTALGQSVAEASLSLESYPLASQLRVDGVHVTPRSALLELALSAARSGGYAKNGKNGSGEEGLALEEVKLNATLPIREAGGKKLQLIVQPSGKGRSVELYASSEGQETWAKILEATIVHRSTMDVEPLADVHRRAEAADAAALYARAEARGVGLGVDLRRLIDLGATENERVARIGASPEDAAAPYFGLHAAIESGLLLAQDLFGVDQPLEATSISSVWFSTARKPAWVYAHRTEGAADVMYFAEDGAILGELWRIQFGPIDRRQLLEAKIADWSYQLKWVPAPRGAASPSAPPAPDSSWLILLDERGLGRALVAELEQRGEPVSTIALSEVDPQDATSIAIALASRYPEGKTCRGIVCFWAADRIGAIDVDAAEAAHRDTVGRTLSLVHALGRSTPAGRPRLWLMTAGAQPLGEQTRPLSLAQSALYGLVRVVDLEYADLRPVMIDLDPSGDTPMSRIAEELLFPDRETQLGFRGEVRYAPRLLRFTPIDGARLPLDPNKVYLVTGGLAGIGLQVGRWLLERGAKRVVLTGRSGAGKEAQLVLDELAADGLVPHIVKGDVSSVADVERLFAEIDHIGPLGGVIHAAGIIDHALLADQTWPRVAKVLAPKVQGTLLLSKEAAKRPHDFFVTFSSMSSLLGAPAFGPYAAANGFMRAFAFERAALGLPSLAIDWGTWADVGIAARVGHAQKKQGMDIIPTDAGLEALGVLVASADAARAELGQGRRARGQDGLPEVGLSPIEWSEVNPAFKRLPIFSTLVGVTSDDAGAEAREVKVVTKEMVLAAPADAQHGMVEEYISSIVARALGHDASKIEKGVPLSQLGLDSLMAVELKNRTETSLKIALPMVRFLEGPSITDLSAMMLDLMTAPAAAAQTEAAPAKEAVQYQEGEL